MIKDSIEIENKPCMAPSVAAPSILHPSLHEHKWAHPLVKFSCPLGGLVPLLSGYKDPHLHGHSVSPTTGLFPRPSCPCTPCRLPTNQWSNSPVPMSTYISLPWATMRWIWARKTFVTWCANRKGMMALWIPASACTISNCPWKSG